MHPRNPPLNRDVFINCPFDAQYKPLFEAICFTISACGFTPRCALEEIDSGATRIEKISRIIAGSALGIHDISRTESGATGLPRFNMPFELGLFLGCKFYGGKVHRGKRTLILDVEPYRYQQFLSDISGQDIAAHGGDCEKAIAVVRDWLQSFSAHLLDGPVHLVAKFRWFCKDLDRMVAELGVDEEHLSFRDLATIVRRWLYLQILAG